MFGGLLDLKYQVHDFVNQIRTATQNLSSHLRLEVPSPIVERRQIRGRLRIGGAHTGHREPAGCQPAERLRERIDHPTIALLELEPRVERIGSEYQIRLLKHAGSPGVFGLLPKRSASSNSVAARA